MGIRYIHNCKCRPTEVDDRSPVCTQCSPREVLARHGIAPPPRPAPFIMVDEAGFGSAPSPWHARGMVALFVFTAIVLIADKMGWI